MRMTMGWFPVFLPHALAQGLPGALQDGVIRGGIFGCNFTSGVLLASCIPNFIGNLVRIVFGLMGIVFLLNILYAGYQIAFSGIGDKEAGKNRLTWACIGFAVTALSFVIVDAVLDVII